MGGILEGVPRTLRVAAGVSLCLVVLAIGAWMALEVVQRLLLVLLPIVVALLLASVLARPTGWLRGHGLPASLAAFLTVAGFVACVAGVLAALAPFAADEAASLDLSVDEGLSEVTTWIEGRFDLDPGTVDRRIEEARSELGGGSALGGPLLSGVRLAVEIVAGALLALVLTFFFLRDGERLWGWCLAAIPHDRRPAYDRAGRRAWSALRGYASGVSLVALLNGLLMGAALWLIGVPLVLPLAFLTFVCAFVPIAGAVFAGAIAALVALGTDGPTAALLVIAAAIVVEQIESNVYEPLIMSRCVELHPVVILVAVAAGGLLLGLVGAFIAVPVVAVAWQAARGLRDRPEAAVRQARWRLPLARKAWRPAS
jgi:predicted PurR-regulated permease PerM